MNDEQFRKNDEQFRKNDDIAAPRQTNPHIQNRHKFSTRLPCRCPKKPRLSA